MPPKTPGKLNPPPPQAEFDALPLERMCRSARGIYHRLHSLDPAAAGPRPPIYFGRRGASRFDPAAGPGTLYLGGSLEGVLMEIFDDRWGPLGHPSRSLTRIELRQWWVTLVAVPEIQVFEADRLNLSKIGTDNQLLSGDHATAREWAGRIMRHPAGVGGIRYRSRHDAGQYNLALFLHREWLPARNDPTLCSPAAGAGAVSGVPAGGKLRHGPALRLADHPGLGPALTALEIAILP